MKKLHKILTLAIALIMVLGIMATPAAAVVYDRMYVVWTEDEFWDLDNPRPVPPENTHITMFVVTKGDDFDYSKGWEDDNYRGELFNIVPTYTDIHLALTLDEVQKAAREAYDRNSDPEWKALIAETFGLKTDSGNTAAQPETPVETEPEKPVTTPETTTVTAGKTTSFSDVKQGDWYYEAVMALADSGILAGYADGTFRPNNTITMGELATIMCRIFGEDTSIDIDSIAPDFIKHKRGHDDSTVNAGHWAKCAMSLMQQWSGVGAWAICQADMQLNRGKAMGMLANYIINSTWPDGTKLKGLPSYEEALALLDTIPDVASDPYVVGTKLKRAEEASHYSDYRLITGPDVPKATTGEQIIAQDYIVQNDSKTNARQDLAAWNAISIADAYNIGLVKGVDSTGRCDPWAPITRAQVVQMLYNMGITQAGQLTRDKNENNSGIIMGMF